MKTTHRKLKSPPGDEPLFPENGKELPERYTIKKTEEGTGAILSCLEAPNLSVRIERGKNVQGSVARKSPDRTIYLDGAAQGEPFMDHEKQVYNLDHHEGCVRSFTYSTCEQAVVMVRKGLNLSEKNWVIWANDPDLDTVLAIWVLLNHIHIKRGNPYILKEILPILRLEGIIDGLGLELQDLVAFPEQLHRETSQKIAHLRSKELELKEQGRWSEIDFTEYTLRILNKIDSFVFHAEDFRDFKGVQELARVDLTEKSSAVAYSADMGIYEMEDYFNRVYGTKPGVILLQKSPGVYTLRKSDLFLPLDMMQVYDWLNRNDRSVDGRDPDNRWGGSTEIGGSPRKTGSLLAPDEVVEGIQVVFRKVSPLEKLIQISWTSFLGLIPSLLGWLAVGAGHFFPWFRDLSSDFNGISPILFSLSLFLYTGIFYLIYSRFRPWVFGFKLPAGTDWLILLPVLILGSLFGGVMVPRSLYFPAGMSDTVWVGLILMPLTMEILFRGILHGHLAGFFRTQRVQGPWFFSMPTLITSLVYGIAVTTAPLTLSPPPLLHEELMRTLLTGGAAFIFGAASGMMRERSDSLVPPILAHLLFAGVVALWRVYFT